MTNDGSKKSPIDLQRESALSFELATDDPKSEHTSMFSLNGGLIIVRDNSIHEVKLADQIDPTRSNPAIPSTVQREVFKIGAKSEIVARTILTARELARQNFLLKSVDVDKALVIIYEAMTELAEMQKVSTETKSACVAAEELAKSRVDQGQSLVLPALGDCHTRAKTFAQKADHVLQACQDLVKLFYPSISTKDFEEIHKAMVLKFGSTDIASLMIEEALPFLKLTRNARNCLDHRNVTGAIITDYELKSSGEALPPTLSIDFRGTKLEPILMVTHMMNSVKAMIGFVETLIAVLFSKNVKAFAGFPIEMGFIPEEQRTNPHIRYKWIVHLPDGILEC